MKSLTRKEIHLTQASEMKKNDTPPIFNAKEIIVQILCNQRWLSDNKWYQDCVKLIWSYLNENKTSIQWTPDVKFISTITKNITEFFFQNKIWEQILENIFFWKKICKKFWQKKFENFFFNFK